MSDAKQKISNVERLVRLKNELRTALDRDGWNDSQDAPLLAALIIADAIDEATATLGAAIRDLGSRR